MYVLNVYVDFGNIDMCGTTRLYIYIYRERETSIYPYAGYTKSLAYNVSNIPVLAWSLVSI